MPLRTNPANPCAMRKEHLLPDERFAPTAQPSEENALSINNEVSIPQYCIFVKRKINISTIIHKRKVKVN